MLEVSAVNDETSSLKAIRLKRSYPQTRRIASIVNEAIIEQDRDEEAFMGHVSRIVTETFKADRFTLQLHRHVAVTLVIKVMKLCVKALLCIEPKALNKIKETGRDGNHKPAS